MTKILIIEDEMQMRRNLATILSLEQFEVSTAENGSRGVELALQESPDLILCDIMMPEHDGYEVLKQLRKEPKTAATPFIFLTAKGEKMDQRAGMNLGADDYLTKPVSTDELLSAIAARLQREEDRMRNSRPADTAPQLSSHVPLQSLGLTAREAEVLFWVAQGKTNPEIAVILDIRPRTVKKHLEHVFSKLGVETRTSAARMVLEIFGGPA